MRVPRRGAALLLAAALAGCQAAAARPAAPAAPVATPVATTAPPAPTPMPVIAPLRAGLTRGVTVCVDGGVPVTVDATEPAAAGAFPAVIYAHGGAWVGGSATPAPFVGTVAAALVTRRIAFLSVTYRLAQRAPWPAPLLDVACALRSIRAHAGAFHLDAARVALIGDSAGGHIVSMLGLLGAQGAVAAGEYASESNAVRAVVDLFGPTDLTQRGWPHPLLAPIHAEFRATGGTDAPALVAASPVTYAAPAPPFLIVHGVDDQLVPFAQSRELAQRLHAAGDAVTLVAVQHTGHELIPAGGPPSPSLAALVAQVVAFLVAELER